jgi:hypothetical protein
LTVQISPSSQVVPPGRKTNWQDPVLVLQESVVQGLPSLQLKAWFTHWPVCGWQKSLVQALPSLQFTCVPPQNDGEPIVPPPQTSPVVQGFPSSQVAPPVDVPVHCTWPCGPDWMHRSATVHWLLSLHAAPTGRGSWRHCPVCGSQESSVQPLLSLQELVECEHSPVCGSQ